MKADCCQIQKTLKSQYIEQLNFIKISKSYSFGY